MIAIALLAGPRRPELTPAQRTGMAVGRANPVLEDLPQALELAGISPESSDWGPALRAAHTTHETLYRHSGR